MRDRLNCEFFLIRYVPDVVKGEFANVGVVLREVGREADALVRFTRDWTRVRCLHSDADIDLLEALEGEIIDRLRLEKTDTKPILELLGDTLSNSIQLTRSGACLAESLPAEIDRLIRLYVEPIKVKQERRRTGRGVIAAAMRREFERAGVWKIMRKGIAASTYTRQGDSMKIDCGYRPNGVVRLFQAVSLDGDGDAAKVLAYSAAGLRTGVERVEGAKLELTAVVEALRSVSDDVDEPLGTEAGQRYRFGIDAMEREEIRVITLSDLARAAETAKREMRL